MKKKFYMMDFVFSKCLRIADVTKNDLYLIMYIKELSFVLDAKGYKFWIDYNQRQLDRDCFGKFNCRCTLRAFEHLCGKNILIHRQDNNQIRINYNPSSWDVSPEQMDKINEVVHNAEMYFHEKT